jgi:hypothetical protein
MEQMINMYNILVLKHNGKKPVGRSRRRWENNVKMYLKEFWCEGVEELHVAQDGVQKWNLVNTLMILQVP